MAGEDPEINVTVSADSYAILYCADDTEVGLGSSQCRYLLNSVESAEQFLESIEDAEQCSLELHEVTLADDVLDILEKGLLTVEDA